MNTSMIHEQLFRAMARGQVDRVREILSANKTMARDDSLLISAIENDCRAEVIELLLDAGWNSNARNPHFNQTALMLAAEHGLSRVVSSLLNHGADKSAVNDNGSNAAQFACSEKAVGNCESLRILIAHGIDVNQGQFYSPLMWAIEYGTDEMVADLLAAGADPNRFYGRGNALYSAIENNRPTAASILLKNGADPMRTIPVPWNPREYAGLTLLDVAKRIKRPKLVDVLEGKQLPISSAKIVLLPAMWKQIETKLVAVDCEVADILNPQATDTEIDEVDRSLNVTLPPAVKASWKIHNGQPVGVACFRLRTGGMAELAGEADLFRLLPIAELAAEKERAADSYAPMAEEIGRFQGESGISPVAWSAHWLPVARNLCGDLLCCDIAPPPPGVPGQIILVSSESPIRTRVADDWCGCLEKLDVGLEEDDTE